MIRVFFVAYFGVWFFLVFLFLWGLSLWFGRRLGVAGGFGGFLFLFFFVSAVCASFLGGGWFGLVFLVGVFLC